MGIGIVIGGISLYRSYALYEEEKEYNVLKGQIPDFGYDAKISFTIDGKKINQAFPLKDDNYVGDSVECRDGVKAEWDNINWSLKNIDSNNNELIRCTVNFKEKMNVNLAEYVTNLALENNNVVVKDDANNPRYIGANPNNYVWFNNELWRIIGVFDDNKVKIIRKQALANMVYAFKGNATSGQYTVTISSDWTKSNLNVRYLNGNFYNSLTNGAKNLMDLNHVWHIGGASNWSQTAQVLYEAEQGTEVPDGYSAEWSGNIGLMFASDYGYATGGGKSKDRSTCLNAKLSDWNLGNEYSDCVNNDWLFQKECQKLEENDERCNQWTMTICSKNSQVQILGSINENGYTVGAYAIASYLVRPVVYLKEDVTIYGGTGTENDPYLLK